MSYSSLLKQKDNEQEDKDIRCPICLFYFSSFTKPYILPCNHNLCLNCINSLVSSGSLFCPLCQSGFLREDKEKFQVNFSFLNLVSKILKTKAIYCKKCSKIFNWSSHHSICSQSDFSETNEIISDIKHLGEECFVLLKYFTHHKNILTSSKEGVYALLSETIDNLNNIFVINCEKAVEAFYDTVPNVNLDLAKKEIVRFLELCKPCYESFEAFDVKELGELIEKHKDIFNTESNDDSGLNYQMKGKEIKGYKSHLICSKTMKKSHSPSPLSKRGNAFDRKALERKELELSEEDILDDDMVIQDEEISQGNEMKIHSFVHLHKGQAEDKSHIKSPDVSKKALSSKTGFISSLFKEEANKEEPSPSQKKKRIIANNKGINIVSLMSPIQDSHKAASEVKQSFSNIRESECDENLSSRYDYNCPEESYDKVHPYSGANPLPFHKINQPHDIFTQAVNKDIKKSMTSKESSRFKQNFDEGLHLNQSHQGSQSFSQINKIIRSFNKIKDITNKLVKYSSVITATTKEVKEQIDKNYSILGKQINYDLLKLLDNIQFNFKQTTKRSLISLIQNTKSIVLHDVKRNKTEVKEFAHLPYKLNHSMSVEFDDCDLIFLSGGKAKEEGSDSSIINRLLIVRWSNTQLKFEADLPMPIIRAYHSSIYFNSKLYIVGGISENSLNLRDCANYSIIEHKWEQMPYINYPRSNPALCIYNQSFLYVFRGSDKDCQLDTIEFLNLSHYSVGWTVFQPEDPGRSWFGCELSSAVVVSEQKIVIFGGLNEKKALNDISFVFDPTKNIVYRGRDLACPAAFVSSGIFLQDRIYAIDVKNNGQKNWGIHSYDVKNCVWTFS